MLSSARTFVRPHRGSPSLAHIWARWNSGTAAAAEPTGEPGKVPPVPGTSAPKASKKPLKSRAKGIQYYQTGELDITEQEYASSVVHGRSFHDPYYHPRTHNIPVALIHFRSYFPDLIRLFVHFASHAASSLAIPISKPISLPTQRSMWTVPKGPFVHKKSQENFERKVHKRAIKAWDADPEVVERWVRYLEKHQFGPVGMRVTRWERAPVGVGEKQLKDAMSRVRTSPVTNAQKVKALGEEIVEKEIAASVQAEKGQEIVQEQVAPPPSDSKEKTP